MNNVYFWNSTFVISLGNEALLVRLLSSQICTFLGTLSFILFFNNFFFLTYITGITNLVVLMNKNVKEMLHFRTLYVLEMMDLFKERWRGVQDRPTFVFQFFYY